MSDHLIDFDLTNDNELFKRNAPRVPQLDGDSQYKDNTHKTNDTVDNRPRRPLQTEIELEVPVYPTVDIE